jgi:hypothetical protein
MPRKKPTPPSHQKKPLSKSDIKVLINESLNKSFEKKLQRLDKSLGSIVDRLNGLEANVEIQIARNDELRARLNIMSSNIGELNDRTSIEELVHKPNILGFIVFLLSIVVMLLFFLMLIIPGSQVFFILITGFLLGFIISNVLTEKTMLPLLHRPRGHTANATTTPVASSKSPQD